MSPKSEPFPLKPPSISPARLPATLLSPLPNTDLAMALPAVFVKSSGMCLNSPI